MKIAENRRNGWENDSSRRVSTGELEYYPLPVNGYKYKHFIVLGVCVAINIICILYFFCIKENTFSSVDKESNFLFCCHESLHCWLEKTKREYLIKRDETVDIKTLISYWYHRCI